MNSFIQDSTDTHHTSNSVSSNTIGFILIAISTFLVCALFMTTSPTSIFCEMIFGDYDVPPDSVKYKCAFMADTSVPEVSVELWLLSSAFITYAMLVLICGVIMLFLFLTKYEIVWQIIIFGGLALAVLGLTVAAIVSDDINGAVYNPPQHHELFMWQECINTAANTAMDAYHNGFGPGAAGAALEYNLETCNHKFPEAASMP